MTAITVDIAAFHANSSVLRCHGSYGQYGLFFFCTRYDVKRPSNEPAETRGYGL